MGLISHIKQRYYNYKFEKADKLSVENRSDEAEVIYLDILDKHPYAATRLAEYYFSLAKNTDVNGAKSLLKKAIDLEVQAESVYDVSSYNTSLQNFSLYIQQKAEALFVAGSYVDCCSLIKVLNDSRHKTERTQDIFCESKINQIFKDIRKTNVSDLTFTSLISELKTEWNRGKNIQGVIAATKKLIDELINSKRFYAANSILTITGDKASNSTVLDNATQIVKGNDKEATSLELRNTVSTHCKAIVLRENISVGEAVSIFENCWKVSKDVSTLMDTLKSANPGIKEALINSIFNNHKKFLSDKKMLDEFSTWLRNGNEPETSLKNLEKLHKLGYNVENLYIDRLHTWIKTLAIDQKVKYLDIAQVLFPDSKIVIEDKLECAKQYESKGENDKAINVADSIAKKCNEAYFVKAKSLYNKAQTANNTELKESLLTNALTAVKQVSGNLTNQLTDNIKNSLVDVANQYYPSQLDRAYTLLQKLSKEGVEKALFSISEHRVTEAKALSEASDKYKFTTKAIDEINSYKLKGITKHPSYQLLWDIKIASAIESLKGSNNQDAVIELEKINKQLEATGFEQELTKSKSKSIIEEIIRRKYLIARDLEVNKNFADAANLYKDISKLESKRTPTLSALRFIICKLKIQDNNDILGHKDMIYNLLRKAAAAYKAEKEDIAYRFSLILLKSGEDKEALAVLNEFLPNEEFLKKACEQGDMIKAQAKLEDFNNKLDAVKNKTLSSDDAVFFINHMLEYADIIKPILNIPRNTLVKYRNKLKNYAIFKLFDEERYNVAFEKMLKEHTNFLDDLSALRNLALTCLNMAEAKQITTQNYKEVISVWLTAIYQERLFIKSLDYTSWDDQFTFSLYDAYGHFNEFELEDLPDNVNFDDTDDDGIVSIKEVQRTLLDRFEAAISDSQVYHDFFTSQKDAMDAFIALNLDEKCKLVAPYIAKQDVDIFDGISGALEHDRQQGYDNWEDVLSVGAIFQMPQSIYTDYSNAKEYYTDCTSALYNLDATKFQSAKVALIKRFNKLYSALSSAVSSKISSLSSQNKTEFKKNFKFYYAVCDSMKDKTLSFLLSNYIMSFVVGEVNDKRMKLAEASEYILSAFLLDTSNAKVKDNLKTLFEMLCRETGTESSTAVNTILSKVRAHDTSFYNTLNSELQDAKISKELNSIVDKVNNHTMSEKDALNKVKAMYDANPNHEGICANLAQLAEICIMKYIVRDDYGASSVKSVLNSIINNKSAEFTRHSSIFRTAYNDIWDQLPDDTKFLLDDRLGGLALGQTLNDKGLALKEGLNYMKKLGGFSGSSLFDRFGGLR